MHKVYQVWDQWSRRYIWCKVLFMPYAQQSYLEIHMLFWFLHTAWYCVSTNDSNHHVLNVLHWSHQHCMNFHAVVTKLCASCFGMHWLHSKTWYGFFRLIPSASTSQSLSRVFEGIFLIPTPKVLSNATHFNSTSLLEYLNSWLLFHNSWMFENIQACRNTVILI